MLKNYIKTAWRNLWKGRVFNSMNIVGLAVAVASSTLLLLTVYFEFSYDKFHKNVDNIYQFYTTINHTGVPEKNTAMAVPFARAVKADYPGIKNITRVASGGALVTYGDKQISKGILFADADFFRIFTFPVVEGNAGALTNLNDVVITRSAAKSIFGDQPAVGKSITLKYGEKPQPFLVAGIIDDMPANSSFETDIFVRFENVQGYQENLKHWDNQNHRVYALLSDNANPQSLESSFSPFIHKYFADQLKDLIRDGAKPVFNNDRISLNLVPFKGSHLNTDVSGIQGSPINKTYVIALLVIAVFILLIACINFINLAVARSFIRAREVGVRKTLGAGKWQLLTQFWTETLMICIVAFAIGIALAAFILPGFNAAFRSHISLNMLLQPMQLLSIAGIFIFITAAAGFYPAMLMMRYKTTQVLKGSVNTQKPGQVRNILLVVQFSIATILTICTLITWQQISYLQQKPLGYSKTEVISIPIGQSINGTEAVERFRNQATGQAGIVAVSGGYLNFGRGNDGSANRSILGFNYKGHEIRTHEQGIEYDYVKTLGLKLVAGRDFSKDYPADSNSVVINEKMAAQIDGGKDVVGKYLPMHDDKKPQQVIGIVQDYNFESLHDDIAPMSMEMTRQYAMQYVFVRLKSNNLQNDFKRVKALWNTTFPNTEFNGSWLDENTQRQYKSEQRLSTIFISAAIIAIVISCIGLLAISIMVIVQRTKEIGIRKVLGSSVANIVMLISKEFVRLVLLAAIIAFPIAWFTMHKWLEGFAYRITIHWWIFALATVIALVIAMLTISYQAIRAALANPVRSLKNE
ncbi:ABC transporter permease [Mucilaginibacter ginkgonis]|uniref:ABC transporter permease n=1 Tax=Mucilaginibacter ginkgonis TaxID=2682091 RepID=A0A6I4IN77_9SPHI|nr:ABC transporter permease [Mucilaginibacter ginkgonis]QQL51324.1 ABC transporter permease [Mucilaginibacter ginkgonis]